MLSAVHLRIFNRLKLQKPLFYASRILLCVSAIFHWCVAQGKVIGVSIGCSLKMPLKPTALRFPRFTSSSASHSSCESLDAKTKPWLLVGLGNPGRIYYGTRHNVGFQMIDVIAQAEGISLSTMKFRALIGKGQIANVPVILAKPQTFMNLSGESTIEVLASDMNYTSENPSQSVAMFLSDQNASYVCMTLTKVAPLVSYYKLPLSQVLLIFDDMDLAFATLRLLPKGGHGGHNGVKSIINHLKGNREFPRLRIGIGRPPGKMDPINYVLRRFSGSEREEMEETLQDGLEAVRMLITNGFNTTANIVNRAQKTKTQNS